MTLIASISGIRGTIGGQPGEGLTPVDLVKFCTAYAEYILSNNRGRCIVVGRDARVSGEMVSRLVTGTLMACGLDVLDLGLTTTPTLETKVPRVHAAGGIVLTASHNPGEWNALKLLDHQGCFMGSEEGTALLKRVQAGELEAYASVDELGQYRTDDQALEEHLDEIMALPSVQPEAIARMGWRIMVDGINSTGALAVPALLRRLGVQQIDVLNANGPDFNVMENVIYFYNKLKMDSKIPYARFAGRGAAPANYQISIDQLERDEIRFEKFLIRLRSIFQEIVVKPLYIQMCLDFPELSKDRKFKADLGLDYYSENQFQKLLDLAHLTKATDFITAVGDIKMKVGEEEKPYFDKDFLIRRFLPLTKDEFDKNKVFKKKEAEEAEKAKKEGGGEAAAGEAFTL